MVKCKENASSIMIDSKAREDIDFGERRRRNRLVNRATIFLALTCTCFFGQVLQLSYPYSTMMSFSTEEHRLDQIDGFVINFTTETKEKHNTHSTLQWMCEPEPQSKEQRLPVPPEMRPFFNFTTSIRTNLKILVLGDSVGIQFSEYLQKVLLHSSNNLADTNTAVLKTAFNAGRGAASIHVTAPIFLDGKENRSSTLSSSPGSGAIAGWRVTGMFLPDAHGWAPANYNRGWKIDDVEALRGFVSNATSLTSGLLNGNLGKATKNITIGMHEQEYQFVVSAMESGDFDVFVHRIPSPSWATLEEVTEETLRATLELANQLFGVRVVVLMSMHFCNNVLTTVQRDEMDRRNRLVHQFARNWTATHEKSKGDNPKEKGGVHTVYVLDQGRLNDELMEWNARLLGFDTSINNYTDVKLIGGKRERYRLSVGHVCGERVAHDSTNCVRNSVTRDGMHPCMNIIGPRIAAGLFCQLKCAYHRYDPNKNVVSDGSFSCAEACNDQYMNATAM